MSYQSLQAHQAVMPPTRELFFWDFDGVICDSVRETAQAGFLTCLQLWPELRAGAADGGGPATGNVDLTTQAPPGVVEGFKRIRPLLHTGWEAVVMVRLLLEAGDAAGAEETAAGITAGWSAATCTGHLEKWGVAQAAVMDSFNTVRRRWIESDRASWTAMHGSYATPLAAFRVLAAEIPGQTYIVTTKSAEFVHAILAHWGVEGFDHAHIFGLGSGDKLGTVHRVVKEHEAAATASAGHAADHVRAQGKLVPVRAHFFEDKLSTLEAAAANPLSREIDVRFYFARWGYNTAAQLHAFREQGTPDPRIAVHETQHELLRLLHKLRVDPASLRRRKVSRDGTLTPAFLRSIAQAHGTPTFVYSLPRVAHNLRALRTAFDNASEGGQLWRTRVLYAMKANSSPAVLQTLLQHGCWVDAVSPGEVRLALAVGFPAERILYTANNVTDAEMHEVASLGSGLADGANVANAAGAADGGASGGGGAEAAATAEGARHEVLFNVGSLSRLRKFGAAFPGARVCVRVNPEVEAGEHEIVKTGTATCKFGVALDRMAEVAEIAKAHGLRIVGLHQHTGSGIADAAKIAEATGKLLQAATALHAAGQLDHLRFIDIGGGIKVPYKPDERPTPLGDLAASVAQQFRAFRHEHPALCSRGLELFLEPGKLLVADAGHLLVTVNTLKERSSPPDPKTGEHHTHRIAGTDSGFNHIIRPVLYQAYHHIVNLASHHLRGGAEEEEDDDAEPVFKYDVAGNICETGDLFAAGRLLRRVREGDLLDIQNAGAYCRSMASEYNMRALPNEVVVVYDNLQPEQPGVFLEPLVKDTVAATVRGAIGHVDASPVVVRAKLSFRRPSNADLARRFLQEYSL